MFARRSAFAVFVAAAATVLIALPAWAVTWTQIASPEPAGSDFNRLASVTLTSTSDAWSVGLTRQRTSNLLKPLVQRWSPTGGLVIAASAAVPAAASASLTGVEGAGTGDVWAVGSIAATASATSQSLLEHFNGTAWSLGTRPANEPVGTSLAGVSALTGSDVWAVGGSVDANFNRNPVIEHFNGTAWSVVPTPALGQNARLNAVFARASTDAWAVGRLIDGETGVVLHWNGTAWSQVALPTLRHDSDLLAVQALSATDVWVVGRTVVTTQALHWNGTAFSVVTTPNPAGSAQAQLAGIAGPAANDLWTVGSSADTGAQNTSLIEHWNGTAWSIVASPNPAGALPRLLGVSTITGGPLLSTGDNQDTAAGVTHTFAVRGQ
jgi:hypothetical protein